MLRLNLGLSLLLCTYVVDAGTLELSILNQQGTPLVNAVATLSSERFQPKENHEAPVVEIQQIDLEFSPEVTVVQTGTAISFPNHDEILHHVYSFSESKTFDLPLYTGTPPEPVVFDRAGLVTLGCNIHDWMRAYVVVVDTPYYQTSSAEGQILFTDVPEGEYQLEIWHPQQRSAYVETIAVTESSNLDIEIAVKPQLRSRRDASGAGGSYN